MTLSSYRLLEEAVFVYDEQGEPLTTARTAQRCGLPQQLVQSRFETFVECALLKRVEDGYRPTVTARELLELDVSGDVVIVDSDTEC